MTLSGRVVPIELLKGVGLEEPLALSAQIGPVIGVGKDGSVIGERLLWRARRMPLPTRRCSASPQGLHIRRNRGCRILAGDQRRTFR